jgi:hypothetical protein
MPFRRDQKPVVHLHHFIPHSFAELGTTALPEKERCAQA